MKASFRVTPNQNLVIANSRRTDSRNRISELLDRHGLSAGGSTLA